MTATNHALSGALIGAFLPLSLAIPVAFASHFVLDAVPHYGIPDGDRNTSKKYRMVVMIDICLALVIAFSAVVFRKWRMEAAGWAAYSPDSMWAVHYFRNNKTLYMQPTNAFMRFHRRIQRYERPWGIYVELSVAVLMLPLFIWQLLR